MIANGFREADRTLSRRHARAHGGIFQRLQMTHAATRLPAAVAHRIAVHAWRAPPRQQSAIVDRHTVRSTEKAGVFAAPSARGQRAASMATCRRKEPLRAPGASPVRTPYRRRLRERALRRAGAAPELLAAPTRVSPRADILAWAMHPRQSHHGASRSHVQRSIRFSLCRARA
ncbi:hypothetical protein LGM90_12265 [Burkholderia sp. AU28942]|uniref:hypothetical protein n=1 Tax=Burkholderia TaxID=32008 RepID=UPI00142E1447|nr:MULTISPECIES: hypothetical protein [Burkholderia]MCA8309288.1 hypothetical protein [Burkholderia sp. AU28942]